MAQTWGPAIDTPDQSLTRFFFRREFFRIIGDLKPEILKELQDEPLATFLEVQKQFPRGLLQIAGEISNVKFGDIIDYIETCYPKADWLCALCCDLFCWALNHNLLASWIIADTLHTLDKWSWNMKAKEKRTWFPMPINIFIPKLLQPPNGFPVFDPTETKPSTYIERLKNEADEAIKRIPLLKITKYNDRLPIIRRVEDVAKKYCKESIEHFLQEESMRLVDADSPSVAKKHLEWAVRFQVVKETYTAIGKREIPTAHASVISRNVQKMLELLDIEKRANAKRGRPIGRKDSPMAPRQSRKQ